MAEGIGYAILGRIGENLVAPIGQQFGYLFCFNTNIQNLETQLDSLKVTREGVQLGVDETRNNVRTVGPHLEAWLTKANDNTAEAETIIKDKAQVQKGCFNGWCPNLKLRYSLGRKAVKKTQELALLHAEGSNYIQSSYNPPPPSTTTTEFQGFDSRILVMNEIIEALKDDGIHLIGICGMGGMGKTTMAKEVAKRTKNLFNEFAIATVSQEPDLKQVQSHIAEMLGLQLNMENPTVRSSRLRERLLPKDKKILVILDDVWKEFDLEEYGFPLEGGSNNICKILFTSRNRNLWEGVQNKRYIELQVLVGDEPWHLFREKVGDCADNSDLLPLAKEIVDECGGLPLALVTVGRALTNKDKGHHWINALRQLMTPCPESSLIGVPVQVYQALHLSYKFLQEEGAKKLFLLCCLFPEGCNIAIEDLVRYGIGLRWFEGIDEVDGVRDQVKVFVDQLKSCYLLLDGDEEEKIKMHDVVHDVAISIAAKDEHGFMTIHGAKPREWPKKATCELNTSISVMSNEIVEFPGGLRCKKLIRCSNRSLKIPDNFFEGTGELEVLDLAITEDISLLPSSLQFLSSLSTLHLDQCQKFDNISVIGCLLNLEILSFRGSDIEELPAEIKRLIKLKLLDLTRCGKLQRIAYGVISALEQLQELYMVDCGWVDSGFFWELKGKEGGANASLREFEYLSNLNTLEINIQNVEFLPRIPLFSQLKKYSICIGYDGDDSIFTKHITRFGKLLKLRGSCTIPLECVRLLLRSSAVLELRGPSSNDAVRELSLEGVEGLQHLKELTIHDCATPEYFIHTMEFFRHAHIFKAPIFPSLEKLELSSLHDLAKICDCQLPTGSFGKLKHLTIFDCGRIQWLVDQSLFAEAPIFPILEKLKLDVLPNLGPICCPIPTGSFGKLKHLEISNCGMEEVIVKEKGEDDATYKMEFPALESMTLWRLRMLFHFFRGTSHQSPSNYEIEFPQLKKLRLGYLPLLEHLFYICPFRCLFPPEVAFPSLEELKLHGFQNMNEIWCNQFQTGSFNKLINLHVSDCGSLRNMFSPFMARHLVHLKRLVINKCSMMEEVVANEEDEEGGRINRTPLPKLEYLKLKDLPELESFCHVTHVWKLPLVEHITVLNCPKMKTFSPGVICTPKLQRVFVKDGKYEWFIGVEGEDWLWINDLNQTILHLIEKVCMKTFVFLSLFLALSA
ncbi:hypothetical protein HYC85_025632 [Camellia sinensis]|uniref:NB-ARC domain-containing protein n=1 Tax=Camellia sinensis TaxID=4442 RepID=A0A7J7GFK0_CAMSI|nr:hypothetical protein HYC85_025632 [Camellia sinensis]